MLAIQGVETSDKYALSTMMSQ